MDVASCELHGDVSIGDALVVLANKGRALGNPDLGYFVEKQGNFGNIMTGDRSGGLALHRMPADPAGQGGALQPGADQVPGRATTAAARSPRRCGQGAGDPHARHRRHRGGMAPPSCRTTSAS